MKVEDNKHKRPLTGSLQKIKTKEKIIRLCRNSKLPLIKYFLYDCRVVEVFSKKIHMA